MREKHVFFQFFEKFVKKVGERFCQFGEKV